MGDSISEGTIVELPFQPGDYANVDDLVAVIETDKVSIDVRAEAAGAVQAYHVAVEDTVEVGQKLVTIDTSAPAPAGGAAPPKKAATPPPAATPTPAAQPAAPAAAAPPKPAPAAAPATAPPAVKGSRGEKVVPMSRMRQRIALNLKQTQNTAAFLTTFNEIDVSTFMNARKKYKDEFLETHGAKLGLMSIFVRASCVALESQPAVNAEIKGNDIIYKDYKDISIAVASPTGLVTPVLRNAEAMSCAEIEKGIAHFAKKAREKSISLEDLAGGTFTISNGGIFGSMMGTPIINGTQSAVLGLHGIFDTPVAVNGEVKIRPIMKVALTYDHRIIDGREAVLFLRKIKDVVEDPMRLVLDL